MGIPKRRPPVAAVVPAQDVARTIVDIVERCVLQVVPPEWRAWLAKTRQEPPSDDEMAR